MFFLNKPLNLNLLFHKTKNAILPNYYHQNCFQAKLSPIVMVLSVFPLDVHSLLSKRKEVTKLLKLHKQTISLINNTLVFQSA